jgi:hypothetical protein
MDVGDPLYVGPRFARGQHAGYGVRGENVRHSKHVFRFSHHDVEQMVRAAVGENRRDCQFFRNRSKRNGVAGGYHAGEPVDSLRELHSSELFHIAVDTGGFVRCNGHDLARAEKSAFGVDLVGGKRMPFQRRRSQIGARPRRKGHMTHLERRVGNFSFRRDRSGGTRGRDIGARAESCCEPQAADEASPIDGFAHVRPSCAPPAYRRTIMPSRLTLLCRAPMQ